MADPTKYSGKIDPLMWNPEGTNRLSDQSKKLPYDLVSEALEYSVLSYPENIGSDRYPFYMMIYVNASTKSKLIKDMTKEDAAKYLKATDTTQRKVNNSMSASMNNLENTSPNTANVLTGGDSKTAKEFMFEGVKKRLKTAIALPMPRELNFSSGAHYKEVSSGGFLGSALNDAASGDFGGVARAGVEGILQTAAKSTGFGKAAASDNKNQDIGGIVQKMRGFARNDRREQLFEGIETREFTFSWEIFPRSKAESETVYNLIKFLRYHMHPEIDTATGGMNFIIPNEFDIEFQHFELGEIGSDGNLGLPKITTCVLKNVTHNGTPLGEFIAFDGTSHPVGITLQLTFRELEPLTRREIGMGY